MIRIILMAVGAALMTVPTGAPGREASRVRESSMASAAKAFLAALRWDQRAKAQQPFNSEDRFDWHFVPKLRGGIPFKEMDETQQKAALQLLQTSLSQPGFKKVAAIRELEPVLHALEQGRGPTRDRDLYYFAVFGEPSDSGVWAWRYEGHHVSLQWTSIRGKVISSTPQFLGSNPADVREGPQKGTRVLRVEEDLGRALAHSLSAEQAREAILAEKAPPDILTGNQRQAAIQEDRGIAWPSLSSEQQGILMTLIQEYANVQRPEMAKQRLEKIRKAGLDRLKFAWMGGLEKGQGHYYRIQGPTFLIEYDNTQNNANHIHTVWRDFKGDFGQDLLAEHYRRSEHHPHRAGDH